MVVGILKVELRVSEANSLKDKRRILKSLLDKIKIRFNVSIAEVEKQNAWQFATLGISAVSTTTSHVHQTFEAVLRFIEGSGMVELLDVQMEII